MQNTHALGFWTQFEVIREKEHLNILTKIYLKSSKSFNSEKPQWCYKLKKKKINMQNYKLTFEKCDLPRSWALAKKPIDSSPIIQSSSPRDNQVLKFQFPFPRNVSATGTRQYYPTLPVELTCMRAHTCPPTHITTHTNTHIRLITWLHENERQNGPKDRRPSCRKQLPYSKYLSLYLTFDNLDTHS